jgi:hypothetical protein
MKIHAAAAALLACSAAGAVTLPEVPATGSRLEDLDRSRFQCRAGDRLTECRRPGKPADRIDDEPVIEIVLFYRDRTLVRTAFVFDERHFDALARKLSGPLGTPRQGSEGLKAGMGGVFQNRYYIWKRDGRAWFAEQFFERIISSGLWILDETELAVLFAEREQMRVRGARDL